MADELLTNDETYQSMAQARNPYRDGNASGKIVDAIWQYSNKN